MSSALSLTDSCSHCTELRCTGSAAGNCNRAFTEDDSEALFTGSDMAQGMRHAHQGPVANSIILFSYALRHYPLSGPESLYAGLLQLHVSPYLPCCPPQQDFTTS